MVLRSRGSEAYGHPTEDGFVVERGSRISPDVTPSFSRAQYANRLYLLAEGVIDVDVFTADHTFPTAAWAASIISGMEGKTKMWKDE